MKINKSILFIPFGLALGLLFLSACSIGKRTSSDLLDTESYIQFVSDDKEVYKSSVYSMKIDDAPGYLSIQIDKNTDRFQNDHKYAVQTGTHELKIFREGKLIKTQKIYIGNRETKRIKL
jgi:hypothetical protein